MTPDTRDPLGPGSGVWFERSVLEDAVAAGSSPGHGPHTTDSSPGQPGPGDATAGPSPGQPADAPTPWALARVDWFNVVALIELGALAPLLLVYLADAHGTSLGAWRHPLLLLAVAPISIGVAGSTIYVSRRMVRFSGGRRLVLAGGWAVLISLVAFVLTTGFVAGLEGLPPDEFLRASARAQVLFAVAVVLMAPLSVALMGWARETEITLEETIERLRDEVDTERALAETAARRTLDVERQVATLRQELAEAHATAKELRRVERKPTVPTNGTATDLVLSVLAAGPLTLDQVVERSGLEREKARNALRNVVRNRGVERDGEVYRRGGQA